MGWYDAMNFLRNIAIEALRNALLGLLAAFFALFGIGCSQVEKVALLTNTGVLDTRASDRTHNQTIDYGLGLRTYLDNGTSVDVGYSRWDKRGGAGHSDYAYVRLVIPIWER